MTNLTEAGDLQAMHRQLEMQKLLIDMASTYINIPLENVHEAIQLSLKEMGMFVQTDRAYIFEYDLNANMARNTYEWCAEGIEPQIHLLQALPLDNIQQWVETHERHEPFIVSDVLALHDDGPGGLRDILAPQGILSLISIPMRHSSGFLGAVGFDAVREKRHFSENEKSILQLFADMLVNIHIRKTIEENRQGDLRMIRQQNEKLKNFAFVVSHKIRSHSSNIEGLVSLLAENKPELAHDEAFNMLSSVSKSMDQTLRDVTSILTQSDEG
jgi:GAF domain-containing protein